MHARTQPFVEAKRHPTRGAPVLLCTSARYAAPWREANRSRVPATSINSPAGAKTLHTQAHTRLVRSLPGLLSLIFPITTQFSCYKKKHRPSTNGDLCTRSARSDTALRQRRRFGQAQQGDLLHPGVQLPVRHADAGAGRGPRARALHRRGSGWRRAGRGRPRQAGAPAAGALREPRRARRGLLRPGCRVRRRRVPRGGVVRAPDARGGSARRRGQEPEGVLRARRPRRAVLLAAGGGVQEGVRGPNREGRSQAVADTLLRHGHGGAVRLLPRRRRRGRGVRLPALAGLRGGLRGRVGRGGLAGRADQAARRRRGRCRCGQPDRRSRHPRAPQQARVSIRRRRGRPRRAVPRRERGPLGPPRDLVLRPPAHRWRVPGRHGGPSRINGVRGEQSNQLHPHPGQRHCCRSDGGCGDGGAECGVRPVPRQEADAGDQRRAAGRRGGAAGAGAPPEDGQQDARGAHQAVGDAPDVVLVGVHAHHRLHQLLLGVALKTVELTTLIN